MNVKLTSPSQIHALLQEMNFRPSKVLGQNFLIDRNIVTIIRRIADLRHEDVALEVGPGLGILTQELVGLTRRVIAIEKDHRLAAYLRQRFTDDTNLELIEADALEVDLEALLKSGVTKVISNLPYAAGNRILVDILTGTELPELILIMVQRDVAHRLAAEPGTKDYGLLSLLTQLHYAVTIEKEVSPHCFMPAPEIWSAIVALRKLPEPMAELDDSEFFRNLVKWAFSQRRKQLAAIMHHAPESVSVDRETIDRMLTDLQLDPHARPGTLSVRQWADLANTLHRARTGNPKS